MGKKEKIIKKLNAEYYKEQNAEYYNEEIISNEEKLKEKEELEQYKLEEKFENTINYIVESIKEHTKDQGLLIFDNLNVENIERYVKFVIKHSSFMKETNKSLSEKDIEKTTHSKIEEKYKKQSNYETIIIQKGMKNLENEYIKTYHTLPDNFHKLLLDKFGYSEYYDTVFFLGNLS